MANIDVLDAAGATKTVKTTTNGGVETPHQNVEGHARTTLPTAVADADPAKVMVDKFGRLVVMPGVPRELVVKARLVLTASTAETTLLAAVANVFNDLTSLVLSNASGTECRVDIRDTTGGTPVLSIHLAASGGGATVNLTRFLPQTSVNTNWTAQCSASVTSVYITGVWEANK